MYLPQNTRGLVTLTKHVQQMTGTVLALPVTIKFHFVMRLQTVYYKCIKGERSICVSQCYTTDTRMICICDFYACVAMIEPWK